MVSPASLAIGARSRPTPGLDILDLAEDKEAKALRVFIGHASGDLCTDVFNLLQVLVSCVASP